MTLLCRKWGWHVTPDSCYHTSTPRLHSTLTLLSPYCTSPGPPLIMSQPSWQTSCGGWSLLVPTDLVIVWAAAHCVLTLHTASQSQTTALADWSLVCVCLYKSAAADLKNSAAPRYVSTSVPHRAWEQYRTPPPLPPPRPPDPMPCESS